MTNVSTPKLNIANFDFNLPTELIAQYPCTPRSASRLLCVNKNTGEISHKSFNDLLELLAPNDLLVFNNTRVIPARVFGIKTTGGKIELLVERVIDAHHVLAHIKFNKKLKIGAELILADIYRAGIVQRHDDLFELKFNSEESVYDVLEKIGHIPLPPYINREDENVDRERYQTIFAKHLGAVAAPTAGLHFDEELLNKIKHKGVQIGFVTLHVGSGTFQPIRVQNIHEHKMHSEYFEVSQELCAQVKTAKQSGGRIIAVGTTTVRSLEAATKNSKNSKLEPFKGHTDIFIYQGYKFCCVDAIITNFHLPKSTLILLICAFAGYETTMHAYQEAIKKAYRFFSYGDAMFLTP